LIRQGRQPTEAQIQQRYNELTANMPSHQAADRRQQPFGRGRGRGRGRINSRGRGRYRNSQYKPPHLDHYFRRVHFASEVNILTRLCNEVKYDLLDDVPGRLANGDTTNFKLCPQEAVLSFRVSTHNDSDTQLRRIDVCFQPV
jgi:hypothetical protein